MTEFATVRWELPDTGHIPVDKLAGVILERRGFQKKDTTTLLAPRYDSLGDPFSLVDMDRAVRVLLDARQANKKVIIYGDYDIDGLTASSVLSDVCMSLGIAHEVYIPDRFEEGYGIHIKAIKQLHQQGASVIVSVDCGSSATEAARVAGELDMKLVITDHHTLVSDELEGATAHINPLREKNTYPEKYLAGVGVAFALARALQQASNFVLPAGQEKWLLDLVALGTICDVVPLVGENRVLAYYGLQVLRKTRRPGLRALAAVSGVDVAKIEAEDLGFKFGPRLNAAGRLEHAQYALQTLLATEYTTAMRSAEHLQKLNVRRQADTRTIQDQAREQALQHIDDPVLVLTSDTWSHGIVGLVASRISEEFRRPAVLLQTEGELAKGSARSYADISIIQVMREHHELFEKYGGHAAAAGMTLRADCIEDLRDGLCATALELGEDAWTKNERIDAWLQPEYVTMAGFDAIHKLEPTGRDHPGVRFVLDGEITSIRPVGADGDHFQLSVRFEGHEQRMIAFGAARKWPELEVGQTIRAVVRLSRSEWQGTTRIEVMLLDILENMDE